MKNVGAVKRESYTLRNKEKLKYNNVTRGICKSGSIFDDPNQSKLRKNSAITLIALVITIILHYDYLIKVRNSNGFLGALV